MNRPLNENRAILGGTDALVCPAPVTNVIASPPRADEAISSHPLVLTSTRGLLRCPSIWKDSSQRHQYSPKIGGHRGLKEDQQTAV